jgi:hypothetical protein
MRSGPACSRGERVRLNPAGVAGDDRIARRLRLPAGRILVLDSGGARPHGADALGSRAADRGRGRHGRAPNGCTFGRIAPPRGRPSGKEQHLAFARNPGYLKRQKEQQRLARAAQKREARLARKHSKTSQTGEEFEPLDPSDLGLAPEGEEGDDLAGEASDESGDAGNGGEPAGK